MAGVMKDKSAAKGVLVTTSWVGKAGCDFAARNGRIEILEERHLSPCSWNTSGSTSSSAYRNCPRLEVGRCQLTATRRHDRNVTGHPSHHCKLGE